MLRTFLAAALLASCATVSVAQTPPKPDEGSVSGKAMKDLPGNTGAGTTDMPTTKPKEDSLSGKAMKDQPGNNAAGTTGMPTAKPQDDSLSGKEMKDHPGNK